MEDTRAKFKKEFKQRLYNWVLRLLRYVKTLPHDTVYAVLVKQLIRSGTSVLANYIEAQSGSSKKDFINFFTHALKSANESKVWLALLRDFENRKEGELKWLLEELHEIANMLASSILTMKGRK